MFTRACLVVLVLVGACGGMPTEDMADPATPATVLQTDAGTAPAVMQAGQGGSAGHVDAMPATPSPAGTGGAQAGTGGQGGQSVPDALPAAGGHAGASDAGTAPQTYPACFQAAITACGRLDPHTVEGYVWQRKDGHRCVTCVGRIPPAVTKGPVTGCIVPGPSISEFAQGNHDPSPVLCVATCDECSY